MHASACIAAWPGPSPTCEYTAIDIRLPVNCRRRGALGTEDCCARTVIFHASGGRLATAFETTWRLIIVARFQRELARAAKTLFSVNKIRFDTVISVSIYNFTLLLLRWPSVSNFYFPLCQIFWQVIRDAYLSRIQLFCPDLFRIREKMPPH